MEAVHDLHDGHFDDEPRASEEPIVDDAHYGSDETLDADISNLIRCRQAECERDPHRPSGNFPLRFAAVIVGIFVAMIVFALASIR